MHLAADMRPFDDSTNHPVAQPDASIRG